MSCFIYSIFVIPHFYITKRLIYLSNHLCHLLSPLFQILSCSCSFSFFGLNPDFSIYISTYLDKSLRCHLDHINLPNSSPLPLPLTSPSSSSSSFPFYLIDLHYFYFFSSFTLSPTFIFLFYFLPSFFFLLYYLLAFYFLHLPFFWYFVLLFLLFYDSAVR